MRYQIDDPYTPADTGCYVDGARGIYATDAVVDLARAHGATIVHTDDHHHLDHTSFDSEFAACEFSAEYADEATNYMNEKHPVEGYYWGFHDGDWGLWASDDDDDGDDVSPSERDGYHGPEC